MCTNFDFLRDKSIFQSFADSAVESEKSLLVSPATSAILTRRALELAIKWVYTFDTELKIPYQDNISSLIHEPTFRQIIDPQLFPLMKYIIKLGNTAVHTNASISRDEAVLSLRNLHEVVRWIDYCYAVEYTCPDFDEELLHAGEERRTRPQELQDLYERLSSKDQRLEELRKENEELRVAMTAQRVASTEEYHFEVDALSEAETRNRYIDLELKLAGWELGRDCISEVPVEGMPNATGKGFVDYVLYGSNGKPLAVIEAKKTGVDPIVGSQQAKLYADCLENQYGQRPVIFTTNGFDINLFDDAEGYPMRRVAAIFTKEELQRMVDRRSSKLPFTTVEIDENISNRYYQKQAIMDVCSAITAKQRKMLLVMATGSGKTRTAVSFVDVLMRHNVAKNILFLADRRTLVKQAKNNFSHLLPSLTLCNLLENKENPEQSRMIFSTYPTMMNAIDDTKRQNGKKLFTPGHFDLIIIDESHRSIYKKYKDIFDYHDAMLLGLTATPKDEIDKNTYSIFELENGVPTFAYELEKAVEDEYLVDYRTIEIKSKIMEDGIHYDDLSEEEQEEFERTFEDDETVDDSIANTAVNEWLFNANTIDMVLHQLMENGLRIQGGDKLGKTIVFAKSSRHAEAIVERFHVLYPEYGTHYVKQIDYSIKYVDTLIDDFSTANKFPQIAVSVDMLDTGVDIPEVLNLVFFKKVRSKSKFWQMIGRGTRLCKDLLGAGMDKDKFLIFDFCNNFEFFRANPKGMEGNIGESLTEKLFNAKLDIVRELQHVKYQEEDYIRYRNELLQELLDSVRSLNEDSFRVKLKQRYVDTYKNKDAWQSLGTASVAEIKEYIAPLITPLQDDELAKRFDLLIYTVDLAYLQQRNASKPIRSIVQTAEALSKLGTIPQVVEKKYIIEKVQTDEFWQSADMLELEAVRVALRELIKFIEKSKQKIYYTNFKDQILETRESGAIYNTNNLKDYKKKVEHYLKEHQDELAIFKLRNNKPLNQLDLQTLERILWEDLGTQSDYEKEFGDTPVSKLVRKMVGLDRTAANEAFSAFLSDEKLNAMQIRFVKLLVDYIVANGMIEDNRVLMEEPFRSLGSITTLFKDHMNEARELMNVVSVIKNNCEKVI
ncbi:DEAD/DEAH box helicase family protein [Paenibacillus sp. GCM10027629]|uniref:DEAD/DEAH box helicase family protein n=1 Tax=Paenibacillus sp. GCM10027629 TaxID=3273414 RepID=UPI003628CAB2